MKLKLFTVFTLGKLEKRTLLLQLQKLCGKNRSMIFLSQLQNIAIGANEKIFKSNSYLIRRPGSIKAAMTTR